MRRVAYPTTLCDLHAALPYDSFAKTSKGCTRLPRQEMSFVKVASYYHAAHHVYCASFRRCPGTSIAQKSPGLRSDTIAVRRPLPNWEGGRTTATRWLGYNTSRSVARQLNRWLNLRMCSISECDCRVLWVQLAVLDSQFDLGVPTANCWNMLFTVCVNGDARSFCSGAGADPPAIHLLAGIMLTTSLSIVLDASSTRFGACYSTPNDTHLLIPPPTPCQYPRH